MSDDCPASWHVGALDVLRAQLTRALFAIAKFLVLHCYVQGVGKIAIFEQYLGFYCE